MKNVQLVAGTPAEMETAQGQLVAWADARIEEERNELADAERNLEVAIASHWRVEPWKRRITTHKAKITFYEKVRAALEAGYYIIPPFPAQVFAIRTDAKKPRKDHSTNRWETFQQNAKRLAEGKGRWVSPIPEVWQRVFPQQDGSERVQYYPNELLAPDFPFKLVKPQIVEATAKAMKEMIFDQIGILPTWNAGGDPIIVGQILNPSSHKEPLTFFIAWWLDTKDL